ncbi:hypothetical protein D9615_005754 [Tricholomella constricta]|uniref:Transmembrane protein 53 n=1 Tax=Tricholomella constricta TaxID=117010 RepID=A0A8H5HAD0_9AGAR|nr:hypothetical protein D9615_005754 [Tricholomella constricta]
MAQEENSTFHCIGNGVYLSPASQANVSSPPSVGDHENPPPTLILIFGWMGAKLPHLLKYTKVYDELYPNATKLLIRCHPSFFWTRESTRRAQLAPVVDTLQALGHLPPSTKTNTDSSQIKLIQPRLLIHAFSNGGCSRLTCLSRLLKAQFPDWNLIQPSTCTLVFDSCPGLGDIQYSQRAFGSLGRNWLLKRLVNTVITCLFVYSAITSRLFGWKNAIELLQIALHNPRLLPWMYKSTPRLYLYSRADEVVPFHEIERHIKDAENAGLDVHSQVFEGTPHVSHARIEPERYWATVTSVWRGADSGADKEEINETKQCSGE